VLEGTLELKKKKAASKTTGVKKPASRSVR
jgi:hypothetical protein